MKSFLNKNIWKIIIWIIYVIVILFAITAIMSKFSIAGVKLFTVQSGSMEPTIKTGSMILTKSLNNYAAGDIVTFEDSVDHKKTITHRIVSVQNQDMIRYTTQGDSNASPDSQIISLHQIIGKVIFSVPYLGYPIGFARTTVGFTILVIIPATIIIYEEIHKLKNEIKRRREK